MGVCQYNMCIWDYGDESVTHKIATNALVIKGSCSTIGTNPEAFFQASIPIDFVFA